ncbi:MAG: hypothetical protein Q9178_005378 [Gyalolechia marmorata]
MSARASQRFLFSSTTPPIWQIPSIHCPFLGIFLANAPTPHRSSFHTPTVTGSKFHPATQASTLNQQTQDQHATLFSKTRNLAAALSLPELPQSCPGCGAPTLGLSTEEQAGYYNPGRKSVKDFAAEAGRARGNASLAESKTFDHVVCQAGDALQRQLGLGKSFAINTVRQITEESDYDPKDNLLAPKKEQVDALMPYLLQVLRDALGPSGKDIRLGNVRCVSAKRGWWTKQVKDEIWNRGGGGWMVGKVNVGKSNLFETVFPKRAREGHLGPNTESDSKPKAKSYRDVTNPCSRSDDADEGPLLPPSQPLQQFPTMPTVSHFPGTTASPIRIPFGNGKGELIDLPGLSRGSLDNYVVESHRSDLVMRQRIKPEQLVIKPGQSLLISGLVRITPTTPDVTVMAYPFVPLASHVTSTHKAIAISTQTQPSGVPTIAKPGVGQKLALAGSFKIRWDVTKRRAGPLTSAAAAGLSVNVLPFVVFSTDILLEGCGWVELVAQLYSVRLGRGAAILSRDVKRIHLDFAFKLNDGHFGARKVWRNYLPRLKYHNPAISMSVNRTQDQTGPATLTIFFASPPDAALNTSSLAPSSPTTQGTPASDHAPFERTATIEMKHRNESEILSELMALTKASPVEPSPQEEAELQELAEESRQGELDRARNAAYNERKRQEKALLDQARGAAGPS